MDRRTFIGIGAASALAAAGTTLEGKVPTAIKDLAKDNSLKIKFLGTGAASGRKNGKGRRHSSILVDNSFLIDLTDNSLDMIPEGLHPGTIFYTHSHPDHFQPSAALKAGVQKVYLSHSWYDVAAKAYKEASKELGVKMPEIVPTYFGQEVQVGEVTVTPLIANHPTSNVMEESQIYLLSKGGVRLLYATDTAGIPGRSARRIGIDAHREGYGITALIMEATMADPDDFRLYCHSSTATVANTVRVLLKTDRLHMPAGQKVYITHMAGSLHTAAELSSLPDPIVAAEDGLEVIFREP
ncbi:MAG: hypothetical protein J6O51_08345 [Bacteroidales bacterium]|nr:hypothetical protein [Bacteroidales bacterium]